MDSIPAENLLGLIVRRAALLEKGVTLDALCRHLEAEPLAVNDELVSFSGMLGAENIELFARFMEEVGLLYVDDYMVIDIDLPDWLGLHVVSR